MEILAVIAPVFLLVVAGYLSAYTGVLKVRDVEGLSRFVFNITLPVLLFQSLANVTLPEQIPWQFLLAYYLVVLLVYGLGMVLSRRFFTAPAQEQAIFGMGSSYSNLMLVGLPIILAGLGDEALLPLFLLASVHSAILFLVTSVFVERDGGNGRSPRQIVRQTSKSLIRNPIIIGLALGFLVNILSIPIPTSVSTALDIIAKATLPCSLFVLGGMLTTYKLAGHFAEAGLIVTLKLVVQPILVWVLVFPLLHLDPLWGSVAVMTAGMPVGISAYIYAQNYHLGTAALSTAVLLSTILALFSQSIWLYFLT